MVPEGLGFTCLGLGLSEGMCEPCLMPKSGLAWALNAPVMTFQNRQLYTLQSPVRLPTACELPNFCMRSVLLSYSTCPAGLDAISMCAGAETHKLAFFGTFYQVMQLSRDPIIEILRRARGSSILLLIKRGPTLGTILCRHFEY